MKPAGMDGIAWDIVRDIWYLRGAVARGGFETKTVKMAKMMDGLKPFERVLNRALSPVRGTFFCVAVEKSRKRF
jgi:hypothetical protein